MQFEHIVVVNDPSQAGAPLSRAELWQGLVRRVEDPLSFVESLDKATIIARGDNWITRELWFGKLCVRDKVTLEPENTVRYDTEASDQHSGGTLTMSIEAPAPGVMFVRFVYSTPLPDSAPAETDAGDAYFAPWAKSAYQQADIDTILPIRELAAAGELGHGAS